jgi:hypothetical protein
MPRILPRLELGEADQAQDFSLLRSVGTGSWLGTEYQGQGIGKEMRSAVLHLAFAGLGAQIARSGAYFDNEASLRVSRCSATLIRAIDATLICPARDFNLSTFPFTPAAGVQTTLAPLCVRRSGMFRYGRRRTHLTSRKSMRRSAPHCWIR